MTKKPFLSVIIPAYNEQSSLPLTLLDIDRHLSVQDFIYEIIPVISPSIDSTHRIVDRFSTVVKNINPLHLKKNKGRGYAIKRGVKQAKGDWKLIMDADNSATIVEFNKMLPYIKDKDGGCDIAIGSRFMSGAYMSPKPPLAKRIFGKIGSFFRKIFFIRKIKDTRCGFRCYSEESANKIFSMCTTNGFSTDLEALALAQKMGLKIKEFPIFWSYDPNTSKKANTHTQNLIDNIKIWIKLTTNSYKIKN